MNTAIYVRVSTKAQAHSQTIEQQLSRLLAHSGSNKWPVCQEHLFRDDGFSGSQLARPGLDQLRNQVRHGAITRVLITAPDRLARKYVHQVLLLEEFEQCGCQVEFLDRPMSSDPHDQLLLQIRGAVAEYERTLITERMRRGRLLKLQAGALLPWTIAPYGYRLDPNSPRDPAGMRIEDAEAAVVNEIFAAYLEPQASIRAVGVRIQARGVPTPAGKMRWNVATIRNILTNPVYMGRAFACRTRSQMPQRRASPTKPISQPARSSAIGVAREHWVEVGKVPSIVTEEQFEMVQTKLKQASRFAKRNNTTHQYLLRSMVSCGLCQLSCSGRSASNIRYYMCCAKRITIDRPRDERCKGRYIPAQVLEELVWQDLCDMVQRPELITSALERAQNGDWLPQQLQARREMLRKGLVSLNHQIERLTEAYMGAIIPLDEYRRRRSEIEQKIQGIERQQQMVTAQAERQLEIGKIAESIEGLCQRVQVGLANANFEQKRQLVELLIDRVVVAHEVVEIRYVIPTTADSEKIRFCQLRSDYQEAIRRAADDHPAREPGAQYSSLVTEMADGRGAAVCQIWRAANRPGPVSY
jgi:site-specific DNA recombinase